VVLYSRLAADNAAGPSMPVARPSLRIHAFHRRANCGLNCGVYASKYTFERLVGFVLTLT